MRTNLKEGLGAVERAGGENLNLPVLKYANLEALDGKIKLTATNLELAITYYLSGKTIEKGKVNVPIATFASLIGNLQSERINLEKRGGQLEVKTDNYEAFTQTLPAEDFPIIPKVKNEQDFLEIEAGLFKDALAQVLVATQFSDLRPELNSLLLDFSLDALRLVGTDSFRLAEKTLGAAQFNSKYTQSFRVLIPLRTAQELMRILREDGQLRIYHDQNQILFKTDQWEIISRLSEGNFPEYSTIVPKKFTAEAVVKREELMNALKLAGIFSSQTSEVKIKAAQGARALEIYSASRDVGENRYLLPAKIQSEFGEVGFNWRYLFDGLKVLKLEEVWLGVNEEENKPSLIRSPKEASYFYILMPILKT